MGKFVWLGALVLVAGCGDKKVQPLEPIVGWHTEETWTGSCYYPRNFEELGPGDRRLYRQEVLEAMMSQWQGGRDDGVSFDADDVLDVETALLGEPAAVDAVAVENLDQCRAAMAGGGLKAWAGWFASVDDVVTEGDCNTSALVDTMFYYLDIAEEWQFPAPVCQGDRIRISGTAIDYYRITDDGPWINVSGDSSQPTGGEHPCNVEGCNAGMLILKFVDYNGIETILPVGEQLLWTAPDHGKIQVRINDTTLYDNKYKQEGGLIHHAGVTYAPVE